MLAAAAGDRWTRFAAALSDVRSLARGDAAAATRAARAVFAFARSGGGPDGADVPGRNRKQRCIGRRRIVGEFTPEQEAAALARCGQEPAPLPIVVQDFVDLIGFDVKRFEVCVETPGAGARLGLGAGDSLLGRPLDDALTDGTVRHAIRNAMSSPVARSHRERVGSFRVAGARLEMGIYIRDGIALLEIEAPAGPPEQPGEAVSRVREMMTVLKDAEDLPRMLDAATRMLRGFSGFDRVMAYRFWKTQAVRWWRNPARWGPTRFWGCGSRPPTSRPRPGS